MKSSRFLSLLALFSLSSGLTARAEKMDEWFKLLPKNTVGLIAVKNTPELLADWDKSSFAKLMADEEFKKWTAPMRKDGEPIWDKEIKENTGEGLYANLSRIRGSVMLAFVADSPKDFEDKKTPMVLLMEVGEDHAKLEEMITKQTETSLAEDTSLKAVTKTIAGTEVEIVATSDAEDATWKKAHAFVGDVLLMADEPVLMEQFITLLKNGNPETAVVVQNHLGRLSLLTEGSTDVLVYLNGETLSQWGIDAAKEAAESNEQAKAMPISPEQIISALGLDELQSMALTLDISDEVSRLEFALLHPEKPTGIVNLVRGTNGEVNLAPFIPAGVLSGSVSRYSMLELWDKLLVIINKMGPMASMATMQLSGVEAQIGVKLREDFFGSLDDEYIEVTDGSLDQQSQVLAFKVKDHERLGGALEGIKGFIGGGFAAFEESDYLSQKISTVKTENAQPGSTEMAFCLTKDYLLFSTGPQALLKKVITHMTEPAGPNIWEDDRVQDLLSRLPKGYTGVGYSDGGKAMKLVVDAMGLVQSQAGKKDKKTQKGKGPKAAPAEEEDADESTENWFDPAFTPSDEMWKRYFGSSVSGYYTPADALHYRIITTPLPAQ